MSGRSCAWIVVLLSLFLVAAPADIAFAQANVQGQWTTMSSTMPINPVHVALLPNGKLLIVAGSGNCPPSQSGCPSGPPYGPSNSSGALLFDPIAGSVLNQFTLSWDMFCNDMALLANGTVLIAGGTIQYDPFYGSPKASIFDPSTNTFSDIANMAHGRWYPTTLTLGDGRIMTFSGFTETGGTNTSVEFYTPGSGWSQEYVAGWTPDMYPRMHLLPNGKVFYSGSQPTSKIFDPSSNTWNTNFATTNYPYQRTYGTSILLPLTPANNYDPKIMIMGGDNPATNSTEIIDMGSSSPAWQWGPGMSAGRIEMNAVILPNGKVLAVGGSVNDEDVGSASLKADLYDPTSNTFSPAGTNAYPRLYHSTALLLPDGTVWLAGGNPNRGSYVPQMEIYKPAYLFNSDGSAATRPTMTNVPSTVQYGQPFTLNTPDAANIRSVVLVHNATVTHAFDKDQREVGLSFTAGSGTLTVTGPPNSNIAPPGYYMLFLLNNSGVPSMANFVQVTQPSGDFSVSATPSSASVTAGSSTSYTVSVTPSSGFNGTVNLSVSGLPSGATGTFSPSSLSGGTSTLTVNTTSSTPAGTSTLTVTGTSGSLTHTAQVSLVVSASSGGGGGSGGGTTGSPVSDEFNETSLNTSLWAVRAPVGGTAAVSNGELTISVPGNSNHDAFVPANDAVQVVQSISNADFDVAVKIDSTLLASAIYSGMGLMVEGDASNYIRYELWANGSSIVLSAYTITSGNQTTQINLAPFSNYVVPTYLRLKRAGSTYTAYWSTDGTNWNQAGSFRDTLAVTGLAPYAFNYNATPSQAPAVNAKFDWFHNLAVTTTSTAATPTFSPASGTSFSSTQSVTIVDSTPNATIYYTTDGSTPTTSSTVYSGPITLSASTTVKAIATASGFTQSTAGSASYTLTTQSAAATPTFSPASGTSFSSTLSVTIADSTPNATIYYTTNGSTPTTSSAIYSGPITLSASATVRAIATASGFAQSAIGSASYTLTTQSQAATPTFSPASGTSFSSTLSVTIADSTPNATIYYTTNGSTPTTSSAIYSGPITLSASATVKAIATASGFSQSAVGSASYTFTGGGGTGGIVSDNFDEPTLNISLWTIENPLGDGIVTMIGTAATLNVPQGTVHDVWTSANNSLRIMQPVGNSNFSVDVRFQSVPEIGNQDEGILVEQDSGDFLRLDVFFNGNAGPTLFAAGITGGSATTFINTQISLPKGPLVLRLVRNANVWTGSWSTDGATFIAAPNFTFNMNAANVGPYAGTYASTAANSPAFTATVDYFFATSEPIANQDGALPYGYTTIDANPQTVVEKTLADIEGTGRLNPVIGTEEPTVNGNMGTGGIYWYQYPASGNITGTWTKQTIVSSGNAYEDMVPFDVNGDGAIDIICSYDPTDSGNYQIVWFENPRGQGGSATTSPWVEHVIGPGFGENNISLADIDGDGKMDIVTPSSIFFQNSPTSWTQVRYSSSFRGVGLLDIGSGLGSINLSGTGPSPFNLVWYENPRETGGNARTGTWIMHTVASTPYPCTPSSTCSDGGDAAVYKGLDVNGDGMMDIISAQSEGNQTGPVPPGGLIWWQAPTDRRNGVWIKHTIDANMIDVHGIALGDMDKNGTTDIIVAEQDQAPLRRVTVYYNNGNGVLTPETISNAEGHNVWVGDITGTGKLDIFNSGHGYFLNAHPLQIFINPY